METHNGQTSVLDNMVKLWVCLQPVLLSLMFVALMESPREVNVSPQLSNFPGEQHDHNRYIMCDSQKHKNKIQLVTKHILKAKLESGVAMNKKCDVQTVFLR